MRQFISRLAVASSVAIFGASSCAIAQEYPLQRLGQPPDLVLDARD
jgi:hypothetical protein